MAAASTHQYPVLRNLLPCTAEQCGRACTCGALVDAAHGVRVRGSTARQMQRAVCICREVVTQLDTAQRGGGGGGEGVVHGVAAAKGQHQFSVLQLCTLQVVTASLFHRTHVVRSQRGILSGAAMCCGQDAGHVFQCRGVLGLHGLRASVAEGQCQGAVCQRNALHVARAVRSHRTKILRRQSHNAAPAVHTYHRAIFGRRKILGTICSPLRPLRIALGAACRFLCHFCRPCRVRSGCRCSVCVLLCCCGRVPRFLCAFLCPGRISQHPRHKKLVLRRADLCIAVCVQCFIAVIPGRSGQRPVSVLTQSQQHPAAAGAGGKFLAHCCAVLLVQQDRCRQCAVLPLDVQRHGTSGPLLRQLKLQPFHIGAALPAQMQHPHLRAKLHTAKVFPNNFHPHPAASFRPSQPITQTSVITLRTFFKLFHFKRTTYTNPTA